MRSRWLIGAALTAASVAVDAQTYDLDITMTGIAAAPVTFSGSFTFNPNGTGFCTAAFCGPGITPDFAEVLIEDPLSIDPPGGSFAFTNTSGGSNTSCSSTLTLVHPDNRASYISSPSASTARSVARPRASA